MKRISNIFSATHVLSIVLLCATLSAASVQHYVFAPEVNQEVSDEVPSSTDQQTQLQVPAAVQSHFHLNLGFDSFLMEEVAIKQVRDLPLYVGDQFVPSISKNFKILLRRIISTNAP
jgi:hypothetical protein